MSDRNFGSIPEELLEQFRKDTQIVSGEAETLLKEFYPTYLTDDNIFDGSYLEKDSSDLLNSLCYLRIVSCTSDKSATAGEEINQKMQKLISALYSIEIPFCYGILADGSNNHLVLGVQGRSDFGLVKQIAEGILSGIKIDMLVKDLIQFKPRTHFGMINGVPSPYIKDKLQIIDHSPMIRALNGKQYTFLVLARPVNGGIIQDKLNKAVRVRDACYIVSKRNVTRQQSITDTKQSGSSHAENRNVNVNINGSPIGLASGAGIGFAAGGLAGAVIGGGIGLLFGQSITYGRGKSTAESINESVSKAETEGASIAIDVQNGFAIELMKLADNCIERVKEGQNTGMWQISIAYSAHEEIVKNILQGCIYSEIARPNAEILPPRTYSGQVGTKEPPFLSNQHITLPIGILTMEENLETSVCSLINTQELSLLCSLPQSSSPSFELIEGCLYPMLDHGKKTPYSVQVGYICDGERPMKNMEFHLSDEDLNKHTFVCGITGSGKTNTVKHILQETKKKFCVIESAKKEYRGLKTKINIDQIFTLGKPELNCPRMNPFYISPGIHPQTHIDYLKDLFNAAFSFYGPMPYILEKCLHNIYSKRGWNLTLGYHPYLMKMDSQIDFFDVSYLKEKYRNLSHKYLFPTMQDLKEEIESYIKKELQYDVEVSGNIKTAIRTRLESLCVGTKGFMYNSNEYLDIDCLLKENCVFELEGLADDSDKAFAVGLLVIFISEKRQTEVEETNEKGLKHLLVIEEAHRLLKNISTERTSENMGNPKGKAVEHFTNMIAEMRSYGQGVIIAEQIPSKIAPDVIKNTSNKIVHRLVSVDDQKIIAGSIGLSEEKAINLGRLGTGYALCHKEGMAMPVFVNITEVMNTTVKDGDIYKPNANEIMQSINVSMLADALHSEIEQISVKLLSNLLLSDNDLCVEAVKSLRKSLQKHTRVNGLSFTQNEGVDTVFAHVLSEEIQKKLVWGAFSVGKLLESALISGLLEFLIKPYDVTIENLKLCLKYAYQREKLESIGIETISELVYNFILENGYKKSDIDGILQQWFIVPNKDEIINVSDAVKARCSNNAS